MREILFKAKRVANDEWVEGYINHYPTGEWRILRKCDNAPDSDPMWQKVLISYEVDENTICQYTGLTDKNGKMIWENDICNCVYDGLATRVIVWDESELDFKGTNGKDNYGKEFDYLCCCEELEVIGNIFDNQELVGCE